MKYFDKTFFSFLTIFLLILLLSFTVLIAIGQVEKTKADRAGAGMVVTQPVTEEPEANSL
jgi:hypothetical protein